MSEKKKNTSLRLSPIDMKTLKMFCVENDLSMQDFIEHAVKYCMSKNILPKGNK